MKLFKVYLAVALILFLVGCTSDHQAEPGENDRALFSTDYADSLVIDLVGADSASVLELLLRAHRVDYRATLAGAFVTKIDSIESSDEYIWMFSVNDSMPVDACDDYITSDGDRVKWHYRKFGQ